MYMQGDRLRFSPTVSPLSLDRITLKFHDANFGAQLLEAHTPKRLGEDISNMHLCGDVVNDDPSPFDALQM